MVSPSSTSSSSEYQTSDAPDHDSQHIFEGCAHTHLSSYTMVMMLVMKHSLTRQAFTDILSLISSHLPPNTTYETSTYKVKDFLKSRMDSHTCTKQPFCEECHRLLSADQRTCVECDNGTAPLDFYDLNLKSQLSKILQGSYLGF